MKNSSPGSPGFWRVEVRTRSDRQDAEAAQLQQEIRHRWERDVEVGRVRGFSLVFPHRSSAQSKNRTAVEAAISRVLVDPVLEHAVVLAADEPVPPVPSGSQRIDVTRKPGVMDPVAESVCQAFEAVGEPVSSVRTYSAYLLSGDFSPQDLEDVGVRCLANPVIEEVRVQPKQAIEPVAALPSPKFARQEVDLLESSDEELQRISRDGLLALNLEEMQTIQSHFRELGRAPTDVELETLAQTWSEHCKHKTLTATVELEDRRYDNLLKDTIFASTQELAKPYCLSVFRDNAGAVTFDDEYAVTFKVETHNHPSALEPYGGAGTGIGGVIRDTMGTGLGAKPILSTDVFCVGPLDLTEEQLPPGTLPPKRILRGVIAGVRDYGNRMGIPTTNGAVFVHADYRANPLVFCGNVGLIPRDKLSKRAQAGDRVFVLGGRTGRDGIHGATFSSEGLDSSSESVAGGAVQIGNPIEEKRLLDACLEARDRGLFTAITDCGAGGLSSAVGEMGEECGAKVELNRVLLKYAGLSPGEIWISEAQERMVMAVPPEHAETLKALCKTHEVEATDLGEFTGDHRLVLTYDGETVADMSMEFVHDGVPRPTRKARRPAVCTEPVQVPANADLQSALPALLQHPDVTSKEEIVRQYDHEVLAGSVVKPMVGPGGYGPSDGCVVAPRLGHSGGVVVACGMSPTLGVLDPYQMALHSIDEAVRNVVSVGGRFDRITLLDNFAWPSVKDEESLGAVVAAAEACRDAALAWETPFISGKDSLNNELRTDQELIRIPPTLLISAMTRIDDVTRAVTMDLKAPGNELICVGPTQPDWGGSRLAEHFQLGPARAPSVDLVRARAIHEAVAQAIAEGLVRSCHDLSEGGLLLAAAEMALAGGVGASLNLTEFEKDRDLATVLYAESPTRYLLEVESSKRPGLERILASLPFATVGVTTDQDSLNATRGDHALTWNLQDLTSSYRTGLGT